MNPGRQHHRPNEPFATRRALLAGAAALAAASALPAPANAAAIGTFRPRGNSGMDHSAFDALLQRFVATDGNGYNAVDYRSFRAAGLSDLKAYLAALEQAAPSTFSRAEAHAYWINLYNAKTLEVVLDHYPVRSIRDIDLGGGLFRRGPWSKELLTVEGVGISLDDIEHNIVRPLFDDPLSHYGLNCASYSCPNLAGRAYSGDNISTLLSQGASDYICHPRGVSVSDGRIAASKIYSWYADDFGGRRGLKPHWLEFAGPDHANEIEPASIGGFHYDWRLNEV